MISIKSCSLTVNSSYKNITKSGVAESNEYKWRKWTLCWILFTILWSTKSAYMKMKWSQDWFEAKLLIDIYCAFILLHSIGYVHGDVVVFNEELGIWQLFDFDNAGPIEEAGWLIITAQKASRVIIIWISGNRVHLMILLMQL
jgi:hypothetical protein